jgi:hypothetical protein
MWFRSLSSYSLSAIKYAFEDYIAHGTDNDGRFWFPAPAQIGFRCQTFLSVEEGKSRKSFQDELAEWKRDKELHPEKYMSDQELQQLKQDILATVNRKTL